MRRIEPPYPLAFDNEGYQYYQENESVKLTTVYVK
jgi:hypothetical protein